VTNTTKYTKDAKSRKSPELKQLHTQSDKLSEVPDETGPGLPVINVNPQKEEKLKRTMMSTDAYVD
jgi:hypothetical protein